jgi:hypothetical protein
MKHEGPDFTADSQNLPAPSAGLVADAYQNPDMAGEVSAVDASPLEAGGYQVDSPAAEQLGAVDDAQEHSDVENPDNAGQDSLDLDESAAALAPVETGRIALGGATQVAAAQEAAQVLGVEAGVTDEAPASEPPRDTEAGSDATARAPAVPYSAAAALQVPKQVQRPAGHNELPEEQHRAHDDGDRAVASSPEIAEKSEPPEPKAEGGDAGNPPELPTELPGEGSREPSALAVSIGGRWRGDAEQAKGYRSNRFRASSVDTTPVEPIFTRAYDLYVQRRLEAPGQAIDPAELANDAVTDADVGDALYRIHRQGGDVMDRLSLVQYAEMYACVRELSVGALMTRVNNWNRGPAMPHNSLEFERLLGAAREVASNHGVDLAAVFRSPEDGQDDLYAEAFRRTYPDGPSSYVQERMMQTAQQGYSEAEMVSYNSMVMDDVRRHGRVDLGLLNSTDTAWQATQEYEQRILSGGAWDAEVQKILLTMQQDALTYTVAKIEEIWGPSAAFDLTEEQRSWLGGDYLGTLEGLPPHDRRRLTHIDVVAQHILAAASSSELAMTDQQVGLLAEYASAYIVRAADLSNTELEAVTSRLDRLTLDMVVPITRRDINELHALPESQRTIITRLVADAQQFDLIGDALPMSLDQYNELAKDPSTGKPYVVADQDIPPNIRRSALVGRQFRLMYPQLFPRHTRPYAGDGYYDSAAFQAATKLVEQIATRYFAGRSHRGPSES